jgi:hypothetical protein
MRAPLSTCGYATVPPFPSSALTQKNIVATGLPSNFVFIREVIQRFAITEDLVTWLPRLNAVAVCQVHQDILDSHDIRKLADEFASWSDNILKLAVNGN